MAYVVCVKFPTGTKLCATAQPAQKGKTYVNKITSNVKGTHTVTWKVNGVKVGSWTFQVI